MLGVCNGFQVLTETGLIPGALMRNSGLKFLCKPIDLIVETQNSAFTSGYSQGSKIQVPIAHHDGNYFVTDSELTELRDEDRVAFRYTDNPNGSVHAIAGVLSCNRRVLGMMPHPERCFLSWQWPYMPKEWQEEDTLAGPWMQMFQNAREFAAN